jgi:hypothetical protein
MSPYVGGCVERAESLAAVGLGRDSGIVVQRMQLVTIEPALDLGDRLGGIAFVSEVDLDVILRSGLPRAILRERMTRAGDHAPPGGRESLDGGVAYASACSGQKQRSSRLIGL